jgi:glycosyltransferase involved in cell wall biosynthesis
MITIHMTTYRRHASGLLRRAVESVLSQDFSDYELVICDDASADGTAEYLAEVAEIDRRVRVVRNARNINSVSISLGRCLEASDSSRPWVSWMFDDCVLLPGALSRLIAALSEYSFARMLYGVTEVAQKDGTLLRVGDLTEAEVKAGIATSSLLVPNAGILVHRDVFEHVGWYDASVVLRRSCDWDLFRRIVHGGVPFAALPDFLVREYGELQPDALRNTFTTTFDLMYRFVAAREASGARLDLRNVLARPVDWIPPGAWLPEDLNLMRYMFVEYFLSIGDVARAFRWARLLAESLGIVGLLMRENLLRCASSSTSADKRALAIGAFAGIVFAAWREERGLP